MNTAKVKDESGYTLVETLVAMVLFLSVLIPVGFGVTAYLFDRKGEDLRKALLVAEGEMSTQDYRTAGERVCGKFLVKSELVPRGTLIEYRVTVVYTQKPLVPLVVISKMIRIPP